MRKIIYFAFFLTVVFACNSEQKPLEIWPMMFEECWVNGDNDLVKKSYPIPNSFYFKNFRDDKKCLKEFLQYIKDTIVADIAKQRFSRHLRFYKKNKGAYMEDGEIYVDQKNYYVIFSDTTNGYFQWISTTSKYEIWRLYIDEFPQRSDYKYSIVRKDKAAVVYFDYKEFNTDVWQKFLNVVFYDVYRQEREDKDKYNLWDNEKARNWHNWSSPTRYSLLNQRTKEIECIIKYPLADNYNAFTIEIH